MSGKSGKPKLTVKQAKFVKAVAEGKTKQQAAMEAYDTTDKNTASTIAKENLQKASIQEALHEALEAYGITPKAIVKPIADALDAEKQNQFTGEINPDHSVRLKAAGMAAQFYGLKQGGDININFNQVASKDKDEFGL